MKVVINRCYGGFGLSMAALKRYAELKRFNVYFYKQTKYSFQDKYNEYRQITDLQEKSWPVYTLKNNLGKTTRELKGDWLHDSHIERDDPALIQVVEELGDAANGEHAELKIVEIPNNIPWEIDEYDGVEHIAEVHRSWS